MEFVIIRTSFQNDEKPCEEAYRKYLTYLDYRTPKTIEEAKKLFWFEKWFEGGINHRVEEGGIVCDSKEKKAIWVIDIKNFEELFKFQKKWQWAIVLSKSSYKEIKREIEIYDSYRE